VAKSGYFFDVTAGYTYSYDCGLEC